MRKLKLQIQITVDGFVAGPNGELDWMSFKFGHDNKLEQFIHELTDSYDTILLGRKMTFTDYWENVKPGSPEFSFAKKMVDIPKVIFTKTLDEPVGKNTSLAKGNLADEIANLKKQNGKDIVVYGGAGFFSSLIQGGHIDEFIFFVNPVMINKGMRIFDLPGKRQKLSLLSSTAYDCGITVISYKLNND